ncbi:MAG: RluA family pseudouridine synthase [Ruminococcaceae bacterium]|nr:RluA family pseudouridine synthase [Oscillospiraceae bacterium]
MYSYTINTNDAGQRLDKFVTKTVRGLPQSLMYKYIRTKRIKVNGKRAHEKDMLAAGDLVEMYIPDEFFSDTAEKTEYERVKLVPEIVYEDENILLCDKKPGILVHVGDEGDKNTADASERETLLFALQAYLVRKGEYNPENENSFAPALCNRIDRNTGGIVILAKNAPTLRLVNEAIREGRVHKKYLCAVHGNARPEATLKGCLRKDYKTKTVQVFDKPVPGGKEILTKYKKLSYRKDADLSLLEVELLTGRTHQIRAHLAHAGLPLLGEGKYGVNREDRKKGYSYQALYSYKLSFDFTDELAYLNGRTFTVKEGNVHFLKEFPSIKLPK